jgi:hypothetical protein
VVRKDIFSGALALLFVFSSMGASPPSRSNLRLNLSLDQSAYEVGEPILAFVTVTNAGGEPFRDLALMDPGSDFLNLSVETKSGPLTKYGHHDILMFSSEGPTLEAGGCACQVVELNYWFGTLRAATPAGERSENPRLLAGEYTVKAILSARLGISGEQQVVLRSNAVRFRVTTSEVRRPNDLDVSSPPAMARSARVYELSARMKEEDITTENLVREMQAAGRSPGLIAAVVDQRIWARRMGNGSRLEWIRQLRGVAKSDLLKCVLDTWERKIRSGKHFYSYGP